MAAAPVVASQQRTFADLLLDSPQPIPEVVVPFRGPKIVDGDVCILFSNEEIENLALPFRFSIVLHEFMRQRPSLNSIRVYTF